MPPVRARNSKRHQVQTIAEKMADLTKMMSEAKNQPATEEGTTMEEVDNNQAATPKADQTKANASAQSQTNPATEEGTTMNANQPHQDAAARAAATTEATDVTPKTNWKKVMKVTGATAAVGALATAGYFAYKHFFGGTATIEVPAPGFFK